MNAEISKLVYHRFVTSSMPRWGFILGCGRSPLWKIWHIIIPPGKELTLRLVPGDSDGVKRGQGPTEDPLLLRNGGPQSVDSYKRA